MFDIGFSELVLIALVALVVLGPERMPRAARLAGLWVRRARAHWYAVKSELEQELAADELKRSLRETQDALRDAGQSLRDATSTPASDIASPPAPPLAAIPDEHDGERRD